MKCSEIAATFTVWLDLFSIYCQLNNGKNIVSSLFPAKLGNIKIVRIELISKSDI